MKVSEMNKFEALSRLKAVCSLLEDPTGLDPAKRIVMIKLKTQIHNELLCPHWDECNELITEDDS